MKNPFKSVDKTTFSSPERQSMGILDDYAVRKDVQTRELTSGKGIFSDVKVPSLTFNRRKYKPLVTFSFDDTYESVYTIVKPIFDQYGITGTAAAGSARVNTTGYLTSSQLIALKNAGWEIASHCKTHTSLITLSESEIEAELKQSKDELDSYALNVKNLVYPYGISNPIVRGIAKEYYRSARGVQSGINPAHLAFAALDTYNLRSFYIEPLVANLAACKAQVDDAEANDGWLIFFAHDVTAGEVASWQELIEYVQAKNIEIVTLDNGLNTFENYIDTGESFGVGENGVNTSNLYISGSLLVKELKDNRIPYTTSTGLFVGDPNLQWYTTPNILAALNVSCANLLVGGTLSSSNIFASGKLSASNITATSLSSATIYGTTIKANTLSSSTINATHISSATISAANVSIICTNSPVLIENMGEDTAGALILKAADSYNIMNWYSGGVEAGQWISYPDGTVEYYSVPGGLSTFYIDGDGTFTNYKAVSLDAYNVPIRFGQSFESAIFNDATDMVIAPAYLSGAGTIKLSSASCWTANGTANVTITNVAPAGVGTATISKWLTVKDQAGTVYYIPAWT